MVKSTTEVILQDSPLECVNDQKILGVKLDNHLTFVPHINFIFSKMSSLSGLLWKIRDCIPETTKLLFYNSYFLPLMDYCLNVWGYCTKTQLDIIYQLQERILRMATNDNYVMKHCYSAGIIL